MVVAEEEREREVDVVVRELQSSRRLVIAVAPASGWLRPSPHHKATGHLMLHRYMGSLPAQRHEIRIINASHKA